MSIKSIPTIPFPSLIFKTGAQKQEQTIERQGHVCTESTFALWGRGCDVTQMAKTSSTFGLKTLWWKIFYVRVPPWKKCKQAGPHQALGWWNSPTRSSTAGGLVHERNGKLYGRGRIVSSVNFPSSYLASAAGFLFQYLSHIPLHWAVLNLFGSWWLEWVHYPVTSFTLWSVFTQSAGAAALLDVRIIPKTLQSESKGYNQRNWDKLAVTFADGVLPLTVRDQLNDLMESSKGNWDWPSCQNKTSTTKCLLFSTYNSLHYKTA